MFEEKQIEGVFGDILFLDKCENESTDVGALIELTDEELVHLNGAIQLNRAQSIELILGLIKIHNLEIIDLGAIGIGK